MKKLLTNVGIQLASSAAAILLADIFLARFSVNIGGFIIAIVIFTLAQSVLERLIPKLAAKHVPALMGRTMWISTWLALAIATNNLGGIRISGFFTWIIAVLIIWALTAGCAALVPKRALKSGAR